MAAVLRLLQAPVERLEAGSVVCDGGLRSPKSIVREIHDICNCYHVNIVSYLAHSDRVMLFSAGSDDSGSVRNPYLIGA